MRINDYYREAANINLNDSIAALVPVLFIVVANFSFINSKALFIFTIPFFLYSIICFQLYLLRKKQAITISRNLVKTSSQSENHSLFETRNVLIYYAGLISAQITFFTPEGCLAGSIKGEKRNVLHSFTKIYNLRNQCGEKVGTFKISGKRIEVFDERNHYLGCLLISKGRLRKKKKELLSSAEKPLGTVEGSAFFMDEKVIGPDSLQVARLRKGWMPLEWSPLFPEPNIPVLSFTDGFTEKDKLLWMSFVIHEYFIER